MPANARDEIRSIFRDYEKKRSSAYDARQKKLLTDAGVRAELENWDRQQKWSERLDQIKADARARFDHAAGKADRLRAEFTRPKHATTNDALLFEMRAQRAWARTRATLDTLEGAKLIEHARRIATEAEGQDAVALAQELAPYLTSRGEPADLVTSAFDSHIPGIDAAQAAADEASHEYRQTELAVSGVRSYMTGAHGRDYAARLAGIDD